MATSKKMKVSDDLAAEHDPSVFEALDQVQEKLDQITDQRSDEILAVERRYNEVRRPVYLERNKLMRQVPDLWLQCLLQLQQIAEVVSERDTDILSYLEEVDVEDFPDIKSGYKITFVFKENPFFTNRQLVKELHYAEDNALAVKGTDVEWTEEGLQHQEQAQQELVNGRKRRAEEATSLFDWFWESGDVPEGIEPISDLIKDELWTNPMRGSGQDAQELQNGEEVQPGSEEEDAGMLSEEQYAEQYTEYAEDVPEQEGADGDADDELQDSELLGSDMQTDAAEADLQYELVEAEPELSEAAEGAGHDLDEPEVPTDYPDEDADPGAAAEDDTVGDDTAEANTAAATADTNGTPLNSALGDKAMQKASAGILIDETTDTGITGAAAAQPA